MELGKTYFVMAMTDEDYYVLLTLCRNMRVTKEAFVLESLKLHIEKLQEEWRLAQKAGIKPQTSEACGSAPQPEKVNPDKEPKKRKKEGEEK